MCRLRRQEAMSRGPGGVLPRQGKESGARRLRMHMYVQTRGLVLVLNTYMHTHINMFTYANAYVCTYSSTCIYTHTHTSILRKVHYLTQAHVTRSSPRVGRRILQVK